MGDGEEAGQLDFDGAACSLSILGFNVYSLFLDSFLSSRLGSLP